MKENILLFIFVSSLFISCSFGQNTSIKLDGIDDVLTFPMCDALTNSSFTIEGWVKSPPASSAEMRVIMMAYRDDLSIANVTLELRNGGVLRFNYRSKAATYGGDEVYSKTLLTDDNWHHFACVKDNNERLFIYIDGFLETVNCFNLQNITASPNFEIGRNKYGGGDIFRWFKGSIDDFKIWEVARSPKQIFDNFNKESAGNEDNLYANYKFDIDSETIFDCSPNKHHGIRSSAFGFQNRPIFSNNIPPILDVDCESLSIVKP
jgi:hypothetical protein